MYGNLFLSPEELVEVGAGSLKFEAGTWTFSLPLCLLLPENSVIFIVYTVKNVKSGETDFSSLYRLHFL